MFRDNGRDGKPRIAVVVSVVSDFMRKGELECWVGVGKKESSQNDDFHPLEAPHKAPFCNGRYYWICSYSNVTYTRNLTSFLGHSAGRLKLQNNRSNHHAYASNPTLTALIHFPMPLLNRIYAEHGYSVD